MSLYNCKYGYLSLCMCGTLHMLPNIITTSQGHFPLSGLALSAGVDWEKIRAYSLDYKKSCKQSHIVATGRKSESSEAPTRRTARCWLAAWIGSQLLLDWLSG